MGRSLSLVVSSPRESEVANPTIEQSLAVSAVARISLADLGDLAPGRTKFNYYCFLAFSLQLAQGFSVLSLQGGVSVRQNHHTAILGYVVQNVWMIKGVFHEFV